MKRIFTLLLFLTFTTAISLNAMAHDSNDPFITELIAGGGNLESKIPVGQVHVWNDGAYLYVKYVITNPDWCLTTTHLHIAIDPSNIPQKNGNPTPGKFEYEMPHECATDYTYKIEMTWSQSDDLYIAAHAEVCTRNGVSSDPETFAAMLPESVNMIQLEPPHIPPLSYIQTIISNGGILDGTYNGWCIDTDKSILLGPLYDAYVFSSYEALPLSTVEFPENFDLVNWILNQNYLGQVSPGGFGIYTMGDMQRAIWMLLEDNYPASGPDPWSQERIDEILAEAEAYGEGFIPGCFDLVAVVLIPFAGEVFHIAQVTIIPVIIPCVPVVCETAWGDGVDFPGKNWALYFTYTIQ